MPPKTKTPPEGIISQTTQINLILLCLGFLIFATVLVTEFMTEVVGALAGSLILTYLLLGPVRLFELAFKRLGIGKPRLRKTLSIIAVYVVMLGLIGFTLVRVIPVLAAEIKDFTRHLPEQLTRLETVMEADAAVHAEALSSRQERAAVQAPNLVKATTGAAVDKLLETYQQQASRLGSLLLDLGTTTLTGLVYALTTLVLLFYLLHDGRVLKDGFVNLMPMASETRVAEFLDRVHLQFHSFLKGQALASIMAGSLMYLLLALLGVKYALMLGMFFGLASILPVIGPWIGLIPITAIIAFTAPPVYMVQVLLFAGIFYLLKAYWLWPKLVNRKYDIHPIIFILTFVACLKLVGYLGILLSFPLASILGVGLEYVKAAHREIPALPDNEPSPGGELAA